MMAPTHRIGGIAAGTVMAALVKPDISGGVILLVGAVLGSLLPDIDNRHSSISRKWPLISLLVTIGQTVIRGLSALLPGKQKRYVRSLIGHRGITHSLCPVIVLPLVAAAVGYLSGYKIKGLYTALGLAGGMLSHLAFDMLAGGVPLLMPFTTKRICIARIKTGGIAEWIFRVILIVIFMYSGVEVISWQKL